MILMRLYGSQRKMALELGVTPATIGNWKSDRSQMLKFLPRIHDQTGLSIATLYELIMEGDAST